MYPDNSDPNNQWWQHADLSQSEDVPVAQSPNQAPIIYSNGFDPTIPTEIEAGTEIEMARIMFRRANAKYGNLIYVDGCFWVFKDTRWVAMEDASMRKAAHQFDGAVCGKTTVKMKSSNVSGIIRELASISAAPGFFDEPAIGLNCLNGVVKFDAKGKVGLYPHDPNDRHRFTIDAEYDVDYKKLPTSSLVFKLLDGCFKDDDDHRLKISVVAEILGAAAFGMATKLKQPKGFIFYGETANNGKSTVASLVELLLPKNAVSHIPLASFADEKRIVNLAGKAANIVEELSSQSIASDMYKAAITGEPIEGRNLYAPAITFRPTAVHIATTNILPTFQDGIDRGLQRRLFVLAFNRVIPADEVIPDIIWQIRQSEMSLLIGLAVSGAARLVASGNYTVPPSSLSHMQEWMMQDPVYSWFTETYKIDESQHWFSIQELYRSFQIWCENEGIKERFITNKERFSRKIGMIKGVHKRRTATRREARGFSNAI